MVLSIIVIIGSFFMIMNNDYLAIADIEIQGQKTLIENDIEQEVTNYLDDTLLGVLPRDNVFILNTGAIQDHLQESFPKIEDIDVSIEDGENILVTIGERSVHSLWCIDKEYESIFDEECYFADSSGLVYARAPYFSGNVYMKFYIPAGEEGEELVGTELTVVPDFISFFNFLEILGTDFPIDISRVEFDDFDDVHIYLSRFRTKIYTDNQPVIIYNQSDEYDTILRNIGVVNDFEEFDEDFTYRPSALESIDVRFDGRVFYTFTPIGGRTTDSNEETIETTEEPVQEE